MELIQFPEFADLVQRKYAEKSTLESIKPTLEASGLVKRDMVPSGSGDTRRYKERVSRDPYASFKPEGGQTPEAPTSSGYFKDATSTTKSKSITISLEMRKLGKNREITDEVTDLSELAPNRMDLDLSLRLGFAFASSYTDKDGNTIDVTVGDGNPACYSAHTLTGSTITCRNQVANNPALSRAAIEAAEDLARTQLFDNNGFLGAGDFDTLVTTDHPGTVNTAKELLQSTADVAATNSGVINVLNAKYRHVIGNRIDMLPSGLGKDSSKAKYWFLASSRRSTLYHAVFMAPELTAPATSNNGEDILTKDWTWTTTYMDGTAILDWRWLIGSKGDATA